MMDNAWWCLVVVFELRLRMLRVAMWLVEGEVKWGFGFRACRLVVWTGLG